VIVGEAPALVAGVIDLADQRGYGHSECGGRRPGRG
jgi:hypothetical protein